MTSPLPVDLVGPGFAVVQADIGRAGRVGVLIDTGNFAPYPVLVTPQLAARLGLRAARPARCLNASLGSGRVCFTPVSFRFRLAGLGGRRLQGAISSQVGQIAAHLGGRFQAVIGGDFLRSHRLTIDYRHRRVIFDGPVPGDPGTIFEPLPAPAIVTAAVVNGAGPFRFLLDTAAADTIATPAVAGRARMAAGASTELYGVGGSIPGAVSPGNRLCSASRCRSGITVKIARLPQRIALIGTSVDGVLGLAFLASGKLTIDYPTHRFWLDN